MVSQSPGIVVEVSVEGADGRRLSGGSATGRRGWCRVLPAAGVERSNTAGGRLRKVVGMFHHASRCCAGSKSTTLSFAPDVGAPEKLAPGGRTVIARRGKFALASCDIFVAPQSRCADSSNCPSPLVSTFRALNPFSCRFRLSPALPYVTNQNGPLGGNVDGGVSKTRVRTDSD